MYRCWGDATACRGRSEIDGLLVSLDGAVRVVPVAPWGRRGRATSRAGGALEAPWCDPGGTDSNGVSQASQWSTGSKQ